MVINIDNLDALDVVLRVVIELCINITVTISIFYKYKAIYYLKDKGYKYLKKDKWVSEYYIDGLELVILTYILVLIIDIVNKEFSLVYLFLMSFSNLSLANRNLISEKGIILKQGMKEITYDTVISLRKQNNNYRLLTADNTSYTVNLKEKEYGRLSEYIHKYGALREEEGII